MTAQAAPRQGGIHYGWIIVLASLIIGTTAYGVYYSVSLFYPEMVEDLGWSRGEASGAITLGLVAYGIFALPMGWLLDRFGPRFTIGLGGLCFGAGMALNAFVTELWQFYVLFGLVAAFGMGAAWAPLVTTVSRWFIKHRGIAVGLGGLGGGTGAVISIFVSRLIDASGWRLSYLIVGIAAGIIIITAALFMYRDPEAKGDRPVGAAALKDGQRPGLVAATGATIGQALHTWTLWLMVVMFGIWWFGGAIIYVQLAPFVQEKGFSITESAWPVVAFGAGNATGKILMGALSDRVGPRMAFGLCTLAATLIMIAIVPAGQIVLLIALAYAFGVAFGGGAPVITTMTAEFFGLRSLGVLMGTMMALMGTIGAGGPLLGGAMFDLTGSYAPAYFIGAALLLTAVGVVTLIRPPRFATAEAPVGAPGPAATPAAAHVGALASEAEPAGLERSPLPAGDWLAATWAAERALAERLAACRAATDDPHLAEVWEIAAARARDRAFGLKRAVGSVAVVPGGPLAEPAGDSMSPEIPASTDLARVDAALAALDALDALLPRDPAPATRPLAVRLRDDRADTRDLLNAERGRLLARAEREAVRRLTPADAGSVAGSGVLAVWLSPGSGGRPAVLQVVQRPGAPAWWSEPAGSRLIVPLSGSGSLVAGDAARPLDRTLEAGSAPFTVRVAGDLPLVYLVVSASPFPAPEQGPAGARTPPEAALPYAAPNVPRGEPAGSGSGAPRQL